MKLSPLPLAAALCVVALGSPALAQSEASRVVEFNRSALDSAAGQAAIERQIRTAARAVCQVQGQRELARIQQTRACYQNAVEDGLRQLGAHTEAKLNTRFASRQQTRSGQDS
ncbi:MAG: UrcA family protein [Glycocaulis sp.]